MTQTQFIEVCFEKNMPCSVRHHLRDQLSRLELGSMTIRFNELSRQDISIFMTQYERVRRFLGGLILSPHMSTQSLVVIGRYFAEVSYHTHFMEEMHHEDQGDNHMIF